MYVHIILKYFLKKKQSYIFNTIDENKGRL